MNKTKLPKIFLSLLIVSLVLFGAGCTDKEASEPKYIDASTAVEAENNEPSTTFTSAVNLSAGEMITTEGTAWRESDSNETIAVEIKVTNTGEENIFLAYGASFFDNNKEIMQSWDSGNTTIEPRETEVFYFKSDSGSKDFFSSNNNSVSFQFALATAIGQNQVNIYKGKTTIPWMN